MPCRISPSLSENAILNVKSRMPTHAAVGEAVVLFFPAVRFVALD